MLVCGGAVVVSVTVSSVVVVVSVVVVTVEVVIVVVVGVSVEVSVSVSVTRTSSVGGSARISARAIPSPAASAANPISAAFVLRSCPGSSSGAGSRTSFSLPPLSSTRRFLPTASVRP